ncbi:MAG: hypothetical protein WBX19_12185 [Terracidiphilus sp.]
MLTEDRLTRKLVTAEDLGYRGCDALNDSTRLANSLARLESCSQAATDCSAAAAVLAIIDATSENLRKKMASIENMILRLDLQDLSQAVAPGPSHSLAIAEGLLPIRASSRF